MSYGWPTTRRYPRTSDEAFPQDNMQWWYPPEQRLRDKIFFWVAIAIWVGLMIYFWRR